MFVLLSLLALLQGPQIIHRVEPKYPIDEKRSGSVELSLTVDADGKAKDIRVVKGMGAPFDQSAIDAVKQWEFKPGEQDGATVAMPFEVTVAFQAGPEFFAKRPEAIGDIENHVFRPSDHNITRPVKIHDVQPKVPGGHIYTVMVEAVIEKDGTIQEMKIVENATPDVDREVLRALKQWKFIPAKLDGTPVRFESKFGFVFANGADGKNGANGRDGGRD